MDKIQWCIEQHEKTNHFYDHYIPYRFHLGMANLVYEQYKGLLDNNEDYWGHQSFDPETLRSVCGIAVFGHDLIEDARASYGDIKSYLGQAVADVIYAVSNEKGKTRAERANDKYYEGIRNTKGAVFIKLCDRIANARYSKMMQSRQFQMYKDENASFMKKLGFEPGHEYGVMFQELIDIFGQ